MQSPESAALAMSPLVKGFGCRTLTTKATDKGGRRPKASKGGNRDGGT